jgi:hypothetical protein
VQSGMPTAPPGHDDRRKEVADGQQGE